MQETLMDHYKIISIHLLAIQGHIDELGYKLTYVKEQSLLVNLDEINSALSKIEQVLEVFKIKLQGFIKIDDYLKLNTTSEALYLKEYRHDIRNYINILHGFTELMIEIFIDEQHPIDPEKVSELYDLYDRILTSVSHLDFTEKEISITTPLMSKNTKVDKPLVIESFVENYDSAHEKEQILQFQILIADDEPASQELIKTHLNRLGYTNIWLADNGEEALNIIENGTIDLLLLDINMPIINGFEILRRIKDLIKEEKIIVLMISAMDTMDSIIKGIELGAEDFLVKPFNKTLLKIRMAQSLKKKLFHDREREYIRKINKEKKMYFDLINAVFPGAVANKLSKGLIVKPQSFHNVAVFFSDITNFTHYSTVNNIKYIFNNLQQFTNISEKIAKMHSVEKIKTIGDAFLGTSGMFVKTKNPVLNSINASILMHREIIKIEPEWDISVGIDYGEVIGGIIGHTRYLYDIWSDTVNTASRLQNIAGGGRIYLSKRAWECIKNIFEAEYLGKLDIKGKGKTDVYFLALNDLDIKQS